NQFRKSRYERMRSYAYRAAIVAAVILAPAIVWHWNSPKTLFAQVAEAMSRGQGFRCDFIEVSPAYAGADNITLAGSVFWNPNGEERLDYMNKERIESTIIFRPDNTGLWLEPLSKRYRIVPKSGAREFSFGLFARLGEFTGKAEQIADPKEIRGV